MENLTLGSVACIASPTLGSVRWLDDASLVFASGNGLIISDIESGCQRRICSASPASTQQESDSHGQFIFDVNGPYLAFATRASLEDHRNMDSSVNIVSPTDFSPSCAPLKLQTSNTVEPVDWLHLSLSDQLLLTVCAHPSHSLDLWELSQQGPSAGSSSKEAPKHIAHIPLGDRLSSFCPSFFPLNPNVIAALGQRSLRLIRYEPGLLPIDSTQGRLSTVFTHDVDLAPTLYKSEVITTPPVWTPSGSLLLGTSEGRIVCVESAAPLALPGQAWGAQGSAIPLPSILGSMRMGGPIVNISLTNEHLGLVVGGNKPHLAWLDAHDLEKEAMVSPIPELIGSGARVSATLSPNRQQWALLGGNGALSLADSVFTIPPPLSFRSIQEGKPEPPSYLINTKLLSRNLPHKAIASCPLPGSLSCVLSQEGSLMVMKLASSSAQAPSPPSLSSSPSKSQFTTPISLLQSSPPATARSISILHLNRSATSMAPLFRNGKPIRQVLIGTSTGSLVIVSMETSRSILAMHDPENASSSSEEIIDARLCFEASAFEKAPVTSVAVGPRGDYCAACCEELNLVAFYRMNASGPEASLSLLGFAEVRSPCHLAFAPSSSLDPQSNLPLLVVAGASSLVDGGRSLTGVSAPTHQGELVVLQIPSESYLNRDADALIPSGLFTRGYIRLQSRAAAISVVPLQGGIASSGAGHPQHPHDESMFFVLVAGEDRSLRRYRLLTEAQKSSAKAYHSFHPSSPNRSQRGHGHQRGAPQFDPAEAEIPPNDLQLPAVALAVTSSGSSNRHLLIATKEGTLSCYNLKDLTCQGKWGLHDYWQGGCSTLSVSVDRQGVSVVSAGADGVIYVLDMIPASVAASRRAAAASPASAATAGGGGRSPFTLRPGQSSFAHSAASSMLSMRKGASALGPGGVLKGLFDHQGVVEPPIRLIQESTAESRIAPSWREARAQAQAAAKMADTKKFEEQVVLGISKLKDKLDVLYRLNSAAASGGEGGEEGEEAIESATAAKCERLDVSELVVDEAMRASLRSLGDKRVSSQRQILLNEMNSLAIVSDKMMAQFGPASELHPLLKILPLPELSFTSQLTTEEARRAKDSIASKTQAITGSGLASCLTTAALELGVDSFVLKKPSARNAALMKKIAFLRKVEQVEWLERPSGDLANSATIAPLEVRHGPMAARLSQDNLEDDAFDAKSARSGFSAKSTYSTLTSTSVGDLPHLDDDLLGIKVKNGQSGLLYGWYQTHTLGRKVTQAHLLHGEIASVEGEFNAKFKQVRELKSRTILLIEEKLLRASELSAKLSGSGPLSAAAASSASHAFSHSPLEEPIATSGLLEVHDSEVPFEQWVSPEERARREKAQRAVDEARRRADADDTKARALREMMAGTLIKKEESKASALHHESWMDFIPREKMTKEQRGLLLEYERKKMELMEEEEKQRRSFEAERKALEVEVAELIAEHNAQLAVLHAERIATEAEVRSLELAAIRASADAEQLRVDVMKKVKIAAEIAKLAILRDQRSGAVALGLKSAEATVSRYEELLSDEKQLDKAFRKEILSIATAASDDSLAAKLNAIYKDRVRAISTHPLRSVANVLGKSGGVADDGRKSEKMSREVSSAKLRGISPQSSKSKLGSLKSQKSMALKSSSSKSMLRGGSGGLELSPGTTIPDDLPPPPSLHPFMHELRAMAVEARSIKGLDSFIAPSVDAVSMLRDLLSGSTSRSPDPLEQVFVEDRLSALLEDADLLGLGDNPSILDLFSQSTLKSLFEPGAARNLAGKIKMDEVKMTPRGDSSPLPWSADPGLRPEGIDEGLFQRLVELRDTKMEVERIADAAWTSACFSLVSLAYYVRDELQSMRRLEEMTLTDSLMGKRTFSLESDLSVTFRLKNGQVDFPPLSFTGGADVKLHNLDGARILRRAHVEAVNQDVCERGDAKLAILEELKSINRTLLLSGWENSSIEMKAKHRQEELAELQCMHLTRDQQLALTDPEAAAKIDHEQSFLKLIRGSTLSFNQQVQMRKLQIDKLSERLFVVIEEGEGVSQLKKESETNKDQAAKIISSMNQQDGMKAFKSIVSNTQLKTIAREQADEIQQLRDKLEKLKAANFPLLPSYPLHSKETRSPPDFKLPPLSSRPGSSRPTTSVSKTKIEIRI